MRPLLDEMIIVILTQFLEKCTPHTKEVKQMIERNDEERSNNIIFKIVSLYDFTPELIVLRERYNRNRFNESNVLEVLKDLKHMTDNLVVLLENSTSTTDCDIYTVLSSEINNFRKRIPDNPCNGIAGCCTQELQCGEGEGICKFDEATNNSIGCKTGFECATCLCPPNDNICPDGESEFDCCTSEST